MLFRKKFTIHRNIVLQPMDDLFNVISSMNFIKRFSKCGLFLRVLFFFSYFFFFFFLTLLELWNIVVFIVIGVYMGIRNMVLKVIRFFVFYGPIKRNGGWKELNFLNRCRAEGWICFILPRAKFCSLFELISHKENLEFVQWSRGLKLLEFIWKRAHLY